MSTTSAILTDEQKQIYKKALRRAFTDAHFNYGKTHWPEWIYDRLTTLAIYGASDRQSLTGNVRQCLQLYSNGQDYDTIAITLHLSRDSVEVYVSRAIRHIVETTPVFLIVHSPHEINPYLVGSCTACKDDLVWLPEKEYYNCLRCDRKYDDELKPIN